jgi:hypothetical protein
MKTILLALLLLLAIHLPCHAEQADPSESAPVCAPAATHPFAFSLRNPSRTRIIQISIGCMAIGLFIMLRK